MASVEKRRALETFTLGTSVGRQLAVEEYEAKLQALTAAYEAELAELESSGKVRKVSKKGKQSIEERSASSVDLNKLLEQQKIAIKQLLDERLGVTEERLSEKIDGLQSENNDPQPKQQEESISVALFQALLIKSNSTPEQSTVIDLPVEVAPVDNKQRTVFEIEPAQVHQLELSDEATDKIATRVTNRVLEKVEARLNKQASESNTTDVPKEIKGQPLMNLLG